LQELARPATELLVLYPILMGAQSLLRGMLIRGGCTATVRTAMALNVAGLALTLVLGVTIASPSGVLLAAIATLTGCVAEWAWLSHKASC
jgi:uncharacterized protein YaaW (UPF0174 family)